MKLQNKRILTSLLFLLISIGVSALVGDEIPEPPPPTPPPGLSVGINAIAAILFGLFIGIRSLLLKKK